MGIFKWLFIVVLVLATFLGAAIFAAVHYIQNNNLAPLATWAAARSGQQLQFQGPLTVQLFPHIVLKMEKLTIPALQGEGNLFTVDAAAAKLSWGKGLLPWQGMQLLDVEAKNPTITLTRTAQGTANWLPVGTSTAPESTPAPATTPTPLSDILPYIVSTKLAVQNLNLTYNDAQAKQKVILANTNLLATTEGTAAVTEINGTVNNESLSGTVRVDVADLANVPLNFKLNAAGLAVAAEGRVLNQQEFAGQMSAQTANLNATLATLLGKAPAAAPQDAFRLTGDVTAAAQKVVLRNFTTSLGDLLRATGNVNITLGNKPSASGEIKVQGNNLRQLAELGSGQTQPTIPAQPFSFSTTLAGQNAIELTNLLFTLTNNGSNVLALKGQASITPPAGRTPLKTAANLNLNLPNLQNAATAFGIQGSFPAQPLNTSLNLNLNGQNLDITNLNATLAELATLSGNASIQATTPPTVNATLKLEGANIQSAARAFGVPTAGLPANPFSAGGQISGQGTLNGKNLTINLPGLLEATANLEITTGTPANINGQLTITNLNATALGYCQSAAPTTAPSVATAAAAPTGASPWSDEPLNLTPLRNLALDVQLTANGISCSSFPVSAASAHVVNTPSQLDVKNATFTLPQNSKANLALTLQHAGTPNLVLTLTTQNVPVEDLAPSLKNQNIRLPLNLTANLNSSGKSTRALAQDLGGTLSLNATQGQLPYTDMLGNVVNLERMLSGGDALPTNGNGNIDEFNARYTIRQGVASTDQFTLATGNGALNLKGEGTIDIGNWAIAYTLTPSLQASNNLAIPLLVKGSLSAPSIGADPAFIQKLTGRLAAEGIKGALGMDKGAAKGVGGVIGDVISGQGISGESVGNLLNAFTQPKGAQTTSPTTTETPTSTPDNSQINTQPTQNNNQQPAPNPLEKPINNLLKGILNN